jgi:hypothetical protein
VSARNALLRARASGVVIGSESEKALSAERLLADLASGRYSEDEAIGILAVAVGQINSELREGGDKERIRRLVDRLLDAAREIRRITRASGFSISVGPPIGVSVSFDWREDSPLRGRGV